MRYLVIGFIKAGQESLIKYLKSKGHTVDKFECVAHSNGPEMVRERPFDKLAVITRDPVDRIWSQFLYFYRDNKMSMKQFLNHYEAAPTYGNLNPLWQSSYTFHLKRWVHFDLDLFELEKLCQSPDFPHENKTINIRSVRVMLPAERKLVTNALAKHEKYLEGRAA